MRTLSVQRGCPDGASEKISGFTGETLHLERISRIYPEPQSVCRPLVCARYGIGNHK